MSIRFPHTTRSRVTMNIPKLQPSSSIESPEPRTFLPQLTEIWAQFDHIGADFSPIPDRDEGVVFEQLLPTTNRYSGSVLWNKEP
jgi:hypothetical protein